MVVPARMNHALMPADAFSAPCAKTAREDPARMPIVRWVGVSINRIWAPWPSRTTSTSASGSPMTPGSPASTRPKPLRRVSCPTVFVKATTRHDQQGNLLAALSDEDVARVAELLPDNEIVRVRSSHDVHFAQTAEYTAALIAFAQRARPGTSDVDAAVAGIEDRRA